MPMRYVRVARPETGLGAMFGGSKKKLKHKMADAVNLLNLRQSQQDYLVTTFLNPVLAENEQLTNLLKQVKDNMDTLVRQQLTQS